MILLDLTLVDLTWEVDDPRGLRLDAHTAIALRGALGHALRHQHCTTLAPTCTDCPRCDDCTYAQLWESGDATRAAASSTAPAESDGGDDGGTHPVPYLIALDAADNARHLEAGASFTARITLIGTSATFIDQVIRAAHLAGRLGLGGRFIRARLKHARVVDSPGRGIERFTRRAGIIGAARTASHALCLVPTTDRPHRVRLETVTRLRLTAADEPLRSFDPVVFTRQLARRLDRLANAWSGEGARFDQGDIHDDAARCVVLENAMKFDDPPGRRPGGGGSGKRTGGLVGFAVIDRVSPTLLAMWRSAELVHAGRMTSLGLGRVRVRVLE